jgi:hypothetical protein
MNLLIHHATALAPSTSKHELGKFRAGHKKSTRTFPINSATETEPFTSAALAIQQRSSARTILFILRGKHLQIIRSGSAKV